MTALETNVRRLRSRRDRSAFTLIELLLVLVILAVLAGIAIPLYVHQIQPAKIKAAKTELANLKQALDMFAIDCDRYPTSEEGLGALVNNPGNVDGWTQILQKIPVDPWGTPYVYRSPGTRTNKDYDLYSCGPSKTDGGSDNIWPD